MTIIVANGNVAHGSGIHRQNKTANDLHRNTHDPCWEPHFSCAQRRGLFLKKAVFLQLRNKPVRTRKRFAKLGGHGRRKIGADLWAKSFS